MATFTSQVVGCFECNAPVTQKRPWHRFCNSKCRMRYYQKDQRQMLKTVLLKLQELELEKRAPPPKRDLLS
jgi:hypothetical protein